MYVDFYTALLFVLIVVYVVFLSVVFASRAGWERGWDSGYEAAAEMGARIQRLLEYSDKDVKATTDLFEGFDTNQKPYDYFAKAFEDGMKPFQGDVEEAIAEALETVDGQTFDKSLESLKAYPRVNETRKTMDLPPYSGDFKLGEPDTDTGWRHIRGGES